MYVVIDVETTGGRVGKDRITEIALYRTDGNKVIDSFSSLINPQQKISSYVRKLTGITDDMVRTAPLFEDVADEVEALTKDAIFVAHNISFDYDIVKREYKRLGKTFRRENLCTVRLAQKAIKGMSSYSLGQLCAQLGIEVKDRHRASGDAQATVELLHRIIREKGEQYVLENTNNQARKIDFKGTLTPKMIESLPEESGVFRFLDKKGIPLFIEASKNIFSGVTKFLIAEIKKHYFQDLFEKISAIDTEVIDSPFIADLIKVEEIRQKKPTYNRKKIKESYPYGIYEMREKAYSMLSVEKDFESNVLWSFNSKKTADKFLKQLNLKNGLYPYKPTPGSRGAVSAEAYNDRHEATLKKHLYPSRNFFIIEEIPEYNQAYIVSIKDYIYQGLGKIDLEFFDDRIETLQENIVPYTNTPATQQIIKKYLKKKKNPILKKY